MQAVRRIERRANMQAVLRACLEQAYTVAELANKVGITRPAAECVVADLISLGWLQATHKPADSPSVLGRPATYYGLASKAGNVLSVDIGAHHLTVATADLAGKIQLEKTVTVSDELPIQKRVDKALALAKKQKSQVGIVHACVVATPGIHNDGKISYYGGSGFPGLQGFELRKYVEDRLQIPTFTAGDCALGAHGETWCGAAAGRQHVVFILAGRRTGAASVIEGRVHGGYFGSAGLIGELSTLRWRELESECFASPLYPAGQPSREEIFHAAQSGNENAKKAVQAYAHVLGQGACAMVLAIAPEMVVVGGQYSTYADLFLADFVAEIKATCPFMPEVQVSQLGSRAVALGGLRLGLDMTFDNIAHCVLHTEFFPAPQAISDLSLPVK